MKNCPPGDDASSNAQADPLRQPMAVDAQRARPEREQTTLTSSESAFRAMVDDSVMGFYRTTPDGRVLFANQALVRMLGYSSLEEVLQLSLDQHGFEPGYSRDSFKDRLAQDGEVIGLESVWIRRDGTRLFVRESCRAVRNASGAIEYYEGSAEDVTERERVEKALRESEERLRRFVESAQDLIYYCDPGGRFTYVNPTAVRVTRYDEHELVGRHFLTLIRPDYRARANELYARQIVERTPSTYFELPIVTKDGQSIWIGQHVQLVSEADRITRVQAIARDISRQKEAEEKLRQSEFRYRSLIQGAAYGIYRSTIDGRILDANPALALMLGYDSVDELMTRNMQEFYRAPGDRAEVVGRLFGDVSAANLEWKRKDGAAIIVRVAAHVVDAEDGLPCVEGIAEDITERKRVEAEREQLVGELQAALAQVKTLSGILPICAWCKKVRNDTGYWQQVESYVRDHSEAQFSHGICPECEARVRREFTDGGIG
jgi:PAS domain S-box-containing protein